VRSITRAVDRMAGTRRAGFSLEYSGDAESSEFFGGGEGGSSGSTASGEKLCSDFSFRKGEGGGSVVLGDGNQLDLDFLMG
jgi:hypothetical protein